MIHFFYVITILLCYVWIGVVYHQVAQDNAGFPIIAKPVRCLKVGEDNRTALTKGDSRRERLLGSYCSSFIQPDN